MKMFPDHQPYFMFLNKINTKITPIKYMKIKQQIQVNIEKFSKELLTDNILNKIHFNRSADLNDNYNIPN